MGRMGRWRSAALVFAVLIGAAELAPAQSMPGHPGLSVTIILDLSYSMRLPLSLNKDDRRGPSRLDSARRLLRNLIDHAPPGTQWSLVTFGGTPEAPSDSGPRLRLGFSTDRTALESKISTLPTWGISPLSQAILYADGYSDRSATTSRRVLLVVSDGINTTPALFEMPTPQRLRRSSTGIVFAGVAPRRSPSLGRGLRSWLRAAGGRYVNANDPAAVAAAIRREAERGVKTPGSVRAGGTGPTRSPRSVEGASRRGIFQRALLALLPLPLLLAGGYLLRFRRQNSGRSSAGPRVPVLRFSSDGRGVTVERELSELPAELSAAGSGGSVGPLVEFRDGQAFLISSTPVLVNGVAVRRAALKASDRVRVGPVVWTFRGAELRRVDAQASSVDLPFWPVAAAGAAVGALLFLGLGQVPEGRADLGAGRAQAGDHTPAAAANGQASATTAGDVERGAAGPGFVALAGEVRAVHPFVHTEMIAPGERPRRFKADMMFIHAHPDDDSIDFGGLMAVASRAGKRIVSVVFTDGNAGLDQFPDRRVGGIYPPHALRGNALARVRVQEAEAALSILGAKEYIRLGLHNNPYDSVTEILPLSEVLQRWGGEAHLVQELAALMQGFHPDIVVSPDERHRGVFKHFEHEAVGYLTNRALDYLAAHGEDFVRAHLIAVDPMLTSQYRRVFGVNVMAIAPNSGLTYRAIQVAALKEHATQRDASVIGVEVVPDFGEEYYVARSWKYSESPTAYFAHLTGSSGG